MEENLLKAEFKSIKAVLDEFDFPNLYTVDGESMRKWVKMVLSNMDNASVASDTDDTILSYENSIVRVSYGATKLVLMNEYSNWVFKIPFKNRKINYCQIEAEIYEDARRENLDKFFAPCYFLENYDGARIYVMQRAEVSYDKLYSDLFERLSSEGRTEKEASDIVDEADSYSEFVNWLFPYYSEEPAEFDKFIDFLNCASINDLHSGNIGYINDRVVLIDYSGYRG